MQKRVRNVLSALLSLCLLFTAVALPCGTIVSADTAEFDSYKILEDFGYQFTVDGVVDSGGVLLYSQTKTLSPTLDFTKYGAAGKNTSQARFVDQPGKLGLQIDLFFSGSDELLTQVNESTTSCFDLTSDGSTTSAARALCAYKDKGFTIKQGWGRYVIDLNSFTKSPLGGGVYSQFDPSAVNLFRTFINGFAAAMQGQKARIAACNLRLVDLTQKLDAAAADEVGYTIMDPNGYYKPVVDLKGLQVRGTKTVAENGTVFGAAMKLTEPIDLTQWGYAADGTIEGGHLALQMDLYITGEDPLVTALIEKRYEGQIELTSSGACDKEEKYGNSRLLDWKLNEWNRVLIDLSKVSASVGGAFDPTAFDYIRVYINGMNKETASYLGQSAKIKLCNACLVDISQPISAEEAAPLGDGTFVPDTPSLKLVDVPAGFNDDDTVVAGYNIKEYVTAHPELGVITDWSPVIQSLLDGLVDVGGGTLYIPAGVYPCYSEISVPNGTRIYGDWKNPDEDPAITGTVLAIYAGEGEPGGAEFLTLGKNAVLQNVALWYPEQKFDDVKEYPPAVEVADNSLAKNITLVNAYKGFACGTETIGCCDLTNIYGTPLYYGMDLGNIADLSRWENIHFAPDYWIDSGLSGAPSSTEAQNTLRSYLKLNANGIILRRIDWSYLMYASVKGYAVGLIFDKTVGENDAISYTNGQCYDLLFEDCQTALDVEGVSEAGENITNLTVKNCDYGVWMANGSTKLYGTLKLYNADISAGVALHCMEQSQVSLLSSVVREGVVSTQNGWIAVMDTVFHTEGPQVVLQNGTLSAVMMGNTDKKGNPITVQNDGQCPIEEDVDAVDVGEIPSVSAEEGLAQVKKPQTKDGATHVTIAAVDNTGATDVTGALNDLLRQQAATGGTVYLPVGRYRIDGMLIVPSGVELKGENDFGHSSASSQLGSILEIYNDRTVAVLLQENSGVRGLTIHHPEQEYKNGQWKEYPYVIQGQGANIYIINITTTRVWNGVDLMTYRCDNHYVEALRGSCLNNFLQVGGGAVGGNIRQCHLHQANVMYTAQGWYDWGASTDGETTLTREQWRDLVRTQTQHNMIAYRIGHVKDQLLNGLMNYSGYSGLQFVAEKTGAADVTVLAQSTDYNTVSFDVQQATRLDFINAQVTAFNQLGAALTKPMTQIHLGADFTGEVNVYGLSIYENPQYMLTIENGTLNLYGTAYRNSTKLANISEKGRLNMVDTFFSKYGSGLAGLPVPTVQNTVDANAQNVSINGGFYYKELTNTDVLGQYDNMLYTLLRWNAQEGVTFPADSQVIFTEAFTEYGSLEEDERAVEFMADGVDSVVSPRGDTLYLSLNAKSMAVGIQKEGLELVGGNENSLYRLETGVRLRSLREVDFSRFVVMLYDEEGNSIPVAIFNNDGGFYATTDNGEKKITDYELGVDYRVGVEVDMRDADNLVYRVYLMDEEGKTLAGSGTVAFPEMYQRENAMFTAVWVGAIADMTIGEDTSLTTAYIDYLYLANSKSSTFGLTGDVDGDSKVTSTDARLVLQYYVKKVDASVLNTAVADVDGSGDVTSTDARLILQYYVKKITAWP